MELFQSFLSEQTIERIGWVLVHFLWQGVAAAALSWCVLKALHKASSNVRYIAACAGLALMVAAPVATFIVTVPDVPIAMVEMPVSPVSPAPAPAPAATRTIVVAPIEPAPLPELSLAETLIGQLEAALPYCVIGWAVGVAVLSVWYLGGWCQLQKLRRIGTKAVSDAVAEKTSELATRLGVKRAVHIAESALVQVPTVIGWLKPIVLLPATALTGLDEIQLSAMIAHEMAHIKRCDYLVNIAQTVVEILGFYHPAVWWMSRQIRAERENCCDDIAVALLEDRKEYAKALFSMEAVRVKQFDLAVAANGGHLTNRITRLAGKPESHQKSGWVPSVVTMLLVAAMLIATSMAMTNNGMPEEISESEIQKTEIYLPDAEEQPVVLDLQTGGFIEIPHEGEIDLDDDPITEFLKTLKQGDIFYHNHGFFCLRGATIDGKPFYEDGFPCPWYKIPKYLPYAATLKTIDGNMYNLNVVEADGKGCLILYSFVPTGDIRASKPFIFEGVATEEEVCVASSANNLWQLGRTLTVYAGSYDAQYPDTLEQIERYIEDESTFKWIINNVTYLGKGKTTTEPSNTVLAYDKNLSKTDGGTNLLFADGHVEFLEKRNLKDHNINLQAVDLSNSQSHLEVINTELEPIAQGMNKLYTIVKNTSDTEQLFGVHIYTRSVDYGPEGIGWGTVFFETLRPHETKRVRFVYKIQGPVTDNTYIRLKFYNPETEATYDYDKPFAERFYKQSYRGMYLPKRQIPQTLRPVHKAKFGEISKALKTMQGHIHKKEYDKAWDLFTEDHKQAEYQTRGIEAFKRQMEPEHPLHSAFTWEKSDFLKLMPVHAGEYKGVLSLQATCDDEIWTIDFVQEHDMWKISWISGYRPKVLDMQDTDHEKETELETARLQSMNNLRQLGLACHLFAEDHDGQYPKKLDDIRPYIESEEAFTWLRENSVLLKYRAFASKNNMLPMAYDKTFLERYGRRIIVFADGHVDIDSNDGFKELLGKAIKHSNRMESAVKLKDVGLALHVWAGEHENVFPVGILPLEFEDEALKAWALKNVKYLVAGKAFLEIEDFGKEVIAYDKNLSKSDDGTNLLFADGHVEFVEKEQLKDFIDITDDANLSQILTTGYLVSVPADMTELEGLVPNEGAGNEMIPPEKLAAFLESVRRNPKAKILTTPKVLSLDNQAAEIAVAEEIPYTGKDGKIEYREIGTKLSVTPHISSDGKAIRLEVAFDRMRHLGQGDVSTQSVASSVTLLSGNAFALGGYETEDGVELFLIQPTILERQSSVLSPQSSGKKVESLPAMGGGGFGGGMSMAGSGGVGYSGVSNSDPHSNQEKKYIRITPTIFEEISSSDGLNETFQALTPNGTKAEKSITTEQYETIISMFQHSKEAKRLSSPETTLLVLEDEQAFFFSGGEIPIRKDGDIEYREIGLKLSVVPHLLPEGNIRTEIDFRYSYPKNENAYVESDEQESFISESVRETTVITSDGGMIMMRPIEIKKDGEPARNLYCMLKIEKANPPDTKDSPPAAMGGDMSGMRTETTEQEVSTPQILTTGYLVSVPADMPELKGIIPEEGAAQSEMILPDKLAAFLESVRKNSKAKILARPKILSFANREAELDLVEEEIPYTDKDGEIKYRDIGMKLTVTPHLTSDDKTLRVGVEFERTLRAGQDGVTVNSVASLVKLPSGHAFAIGGYQTDEGIKELLLIQPTVLIPEEAEEDAIGALAQPSQGGMGSGGGSK